MIGLEKHIECKEDELVEQLLQPVIRDIDGEVLHDVFLIHIRN